MKLEKKEKIHFIGIGGIGMSGLATLLLNNQIELTGSDESENMQTNSLLRAGVKVTKGHSAENIEPHMTVVYSSGIPQHNQELVRAKQLGCSVLHRSELLQKLMATKKALAVTGTHGKTTTSALLSHVLTVGQKSPTYYVGGIVANYLTNAGRGEGEFFVAEADESDGSFLRYFPFGAVITNIGLDHLNYFGSETKLVEAFCQFTKQVSSTELLFWCGDDVRLRSLSLPGVSYGFAEDCLLRIEKYEQKGWNSTFDVSFLGKNYRNIYLPMPGMHNVLNAAAVFGLALRLGLDETMIRKAFSSFAGVKRRTEKRGEVSQVLVLDDYAHHPTEIRATLFSIRQAIKDRRLIAIYEPHRYSRLKHCRGLFKEAFSSADLVFVTDIYECNEERVEDINKESIAHEIKEGGSCCRVAPRDQLLQVLLKHIKPHDVIVLLGAGGITYCGDQIIQTLQEKPLKKMKIGVVRGGVSSEHEVSLASSQFVLKSLAKENYEVVTFTISKEGKWRLESEEKERFPLAVVEEMHTVDMFFPVLHGTNGEDGTIQGFFEIIQKPYTGCTCRPSAVCMDKALTKQMMLLHGIRTSPFVPIQKKKWIKNKQKYVNEIKKELLLPVFVKPSHLGSSIGVQCVESWELLTSAIEKALQKDHELIVEQGIKGREIEFAVWGFDEIEVFHPGEIFANGKVYDYDSKYGKNGFPTAYHADIDPSLVEKGKALAREAYEAAGCDGYARVDFFLDETDRFWLNEINPIPGMTPISLFPQMVMRDGYSPTELMDRMIQISLRRHHYYQGADHEVSTTP